MEKNINNFHKIRKKSLLIIILNFLDFSDLIELSFLCKNFKNATGINKRKLEILNMLSSLYYNEKSYNLKFNSMLINNPSLIIKSTLKKNVGFLENEVEEMIELFIKHLAEIENKTEILFKKYSFSDENFFKIFKQSDYLYNHMKIWLSQSTLIKEFSMFSYFNKVEKFYIDTNFPMILNIESLLQYRLFFKHLEIVTLINDKVDLQYLVDYFNKFQNIVERMTFHIDNTKSYSTMTFEYIKEIILKNTLSLKELKINFNGSFNLNCINALEGCRNLNSLTIKSKTISDEEEKRLIFFLAQFSELTKLRINIKNDDNLLQAINLFRNFKNLRTFPFKLNQSLCFSKKNLIDFFIENESINILNLVLNKIKDKDFYLYFVEKLSSKSIQHLIVSLVELRDEKSLFELFSPLLNTIRNFSSLISLTIINKIPFSFSYFDSLYDIVISNKNLVDLILNIRLVNKNILQIERGEYHLRISNKYPESIFKIIDILLLRKREKPKSFVIEFYNIDIQTFKPISFINKEFFTYVSKIILTNCKISQQGHKEFFSFFNNFNKLETIHLLFPYFMMDSDFIIDFYEFLIMNRLSLHELVIKYNCKYEIYNFESNSNRHFFNNLEKFVFPKLRKLEMTGQSIYYKDINKTQYFNDMMKKYSSNFPNLIRYEIS